MKATFFATLPKYDSHFNVVVNPAFIESIEPGESIKDPHMPKQELLNRSTRIKMQSGSYFWVGLVLEEVMKRITPPREPQPVPEFGVIRG
jgi:hypothetical protein